MTARKLFLDILSFLLPKDLREQRRLDLEEQFELWVVERGLVSAYFQSFFDALIFSICLNVDIWHSLPRTKEIECIVASRTAKVLFLLSFLSLFATPYMIRLNLGTLPLAVYCFFLLSMFVGIGLELWHSAVRYFRSIALFYSGILVLLFSLIVAGPPYSDIATPFFALLNLWGKPPLFAGFVIKGRWCSWSATPES